MSFSVDRIEAHAEVFRGLIPTVIKDNLPLFLPPDDPRKWKPSDILPDVGRDGVSGWQDKCAIIRNQAQTLSKPLRVVQAGNMVTEKGLALFAAAIASIRGIEDTTGIDDNPLAQGRRRWYGDEDRHGTVTYGYANLSGIYNMAALDRSIHIFHINGFDNEADLDIYTNLFFVVKQEKKTEIAHRRTGTMGRDQQIAAGVEGESVLYKMDMAMARDEAPHFTYYRNIFEGVIEHDPEGAVIAIRDMLKIGTIMPARYMGDFYSNDERRSTTLFDRYAEVTSRLGILTLVDDSDQDEELLKRWNIANLRLSGESAEAQEEIFKLHKRQARYARILEDKRRTLNEKEGEPDVSDFSWLLPDAA